MFPLEIFPSGGLATSVITCVWAGVFVVAFFNLRFGWVLTGLVLPGYLVPLLLLKPWSVLAIYVEGVATYLLVWYLSERISRTGLWSRLFGRDRFFALVIASVAVRIVFDIQLLPALGAALESRFGVQFDYVNDLHSLGLIVVALIANTFWKPGLARGSVVLAVTVGITYLIVRFVFVELTNFHVTDLQFAYEDLAASVLASPKAYIILICTAYIASRMNLFYGWEYNGILLPSLLALQWYQPVKILSSFVEAFVILALAHVVLRLPWFANASIEGARKLLLFFNLGYAWKVLLSFVVAAVLPEYKVSDAFAFGYLLSTLMAIKMHDKAIVGVMTRATLQTSLTAVLVATLIGFALTRLPPLEALAFGRRLPEVNIPAQRFDDRSLSAALRADAIDIYAPRPGGVSAPDALELAAFERGLRALRGLTGETPSERLTDALHHLHRAHFTARWIEQRYVLVEPEAGFGGRGLFVFDTRAEHDQLIAAPAAADERHTLEAALFLMQRLDASALAVAGTARRTNPDRSMDALRSGPSFHSVAQRVLSRGPVLQVRAQADPLAPSTLWISGSLPDGLDLRLLEQRLHAVEVRWAPAPGENFLRNLKPFDFAELFLSVGDRRTLLAALLGPGNGVELQVQTPRIEGYLQDWLLAGKDRIAPRGSERYVAPTANELLYLDEAVFTPLTRQVMSGNLDAAQLDVAAAAAGVLDYDLVRYRHRRSGREYLIVQERDRGRRRHWGTFVLRIGPARDYFIQIPRPLYEANSFEYAITLFEALDARALVVAGSHPQANRDGSADVVRQENFANVFNLATQVLLRELPADAEAMVLHSRAYGLRNDGPQPVADVLLALSNGIRRTSQVPPLGRELMHFLERSAIDFALVDGRPETSGYEVGALPQSLYAATLPGKHFGILWLSPFVREAYRQRAPDPRRAALFSAFDIDSREADLLRELPGAAVGSLPAQTWTALRPLLDRFVATDDVHALVGALEVDPDLRFERVVDLDSRQGFLLVSRPHRDIVLLANLNPLPSAGAARSAVAALGPLEQFVGSRAPYLLFGEGR